MIKLFAQFMDRLGSPKDQKSETVALTIVYCMHSSLLIVMLLLLVILL
jgi:hypothetical protein